MPAVAVRKRVNENKSMVEPNGYFAISSGKYVPFSIQ
jgi:hypothetical protein